MNLPSIIELPADTILSLGRREKEVDVASILARMMRERVAVASRGSRRCFMVDVLDLDFVLS